MVALTTRLRRGVAAAAALGATLLAAGCSLSTDPDETPRLSVLYVEASPTSPVAADVARVGITAGTRYIQALGGVMLQPCLTANRDVRWARNGSEVTFRIITTPNNAGCAAGPASAIGYNVYLTNVDAGAYTVRVVHEGDQLVPDGTVVKEASVTVLP